MWVLLGIVGGIALMMWSAWIFALWAFLQTVIHLFKGNWLGASMWFVTGFVTMVWWLNYFVDNGKSIPWDGTWVLCGIVFGVGLLCTLVKEYKKVPWGNAPAPWSMPNETTGNVVPFVKATRDERERVMQIQNHRCANPYCNMDLRQSTPHWDHITPRSKGGTDSVHNMQWLCDTCNLNKKDMDWLEFIYRYAHGIGMDPNVNEKPWQKWVTTRAQNGLQCQG